MLWQAVRLAGLLLAATDAVVAAETGGAPRYGNATERQPGLCSLGNGSCGRKGGIFGSELPCAANVPAKPIDETLRTSLTQVCGLDFASAHDAACCNADQLDTLSTNLQQAQAFIALCPACSKSFTAFYCSFTCSPEQSQFVTVSEVQDLGSDKGPAVKSLDFHVEEEFGMAFYRACKDVKFAATNGLAMDFIGGGAKDWLSFLKYMGTERPGLGSPFQINFPQPPNEYNHTFDEAIRPLNPPSLSCGSSDPSIGCACADCPERCLSLPALPDVESHCHVGALTCGSFFLVLAYSILLLSFIAGVGIKDLWEKRHTLFSNKTANTGRIQLPDSPREYDRMDMSDPLNPDSEELGNGRPEGSTAQRWTASIKSLVGAGSTSQSYDGDSGSRRQQSRGSSTQLGDSDSNTNSVSRQRLGRGASLLSPDVLAAYSQPRTYRLNTILSSGFYKLGLACASAPYLTIALGLVVCGALNSAWSRFKIEKDPVRLWVAHGSEMEQQKTLFEEEFGPFYRTEQIFLSNEQIPSAPEGSETQTHVLNWDRLQWWAGVEQDIRSLTSPAGTSLKDICFAPTAESTEAAEVWDCTVQSFMGYLGDKLDDVSEDTWQEELDQCATNPTGCLSSAGQPLNPRLLFGGVPGYSGRKPEDTQDGLIRASDASAVVITYVIDNSLDPAKVRKAEEWERTLKRYLESLGKTADAEHGLSLSFSTGVSLEEELNKSTNTDVPIVVLSYLVMFAYVSTSLGGTSIGIASLIWAIIVRCMAPLLRRKRPTGPIALGDNVHERQSTHSSTASIGSISISAALRNLFIDSKFLLGLVGIAIVLLSVSTSVGLFSFFGVRVTLIIAEVIPFLVLAIGVDNVFILAHELERQNARAYGSLPRNASVDEYFETGDLPTAEERIARALGRMGPSILLSSTCQTVAFALGATVGMPAVRNFAIYAAGAVAINALLQITVFVAAMTIDLKRIESNRVDCLPCIKLGNAGDKPPVATESLVVRFIRAIYAPLLLKKQVKFGVMAAFSGLFVASWICTDYIQLGLDQRLALPRDSYLVDYFNALDTYLDVGPPVYFVVEDVNVTDRTGQQSVCGRFSTCDDFSVSNVLEAERKRPEVSYLAETPAVWLDDFFQWLNPALESCCAVKKRDASQFCGPQDSELQCKPCYEDKEPGWNISMEGLPEGDDFMQYLRHWLESPANADCALGGKAGYSSALSLSQDSVKASHFRTYHTPLKHQSDYIEALAAAKRISADLSNKVGARVFPYSIFYVYFEQYASIVATTRTVLTLALLAVFLVTSVVLGSWRTGSVVLVTVFMTVMNVMGVMGLWHISLNAISLVNLVVSIGIALEFCSHIARAFMGAGAGVGGLPHGHPAGQKERDDRVYAALIDVGSSVFSGITLTKLIGISVLALTKSKLLEVYYFRMWLTLIIAGALHGLVFLPVALSYQGGRGYALDTDDQEFLEEIAQYRGRAFLAADDDSISSDDRF